MSFCLLFLALGARRGDIFQLIWLETLMICLAGGIAGSAGSGKLLPTLTVTENVELPLAFLGLIPDSKRTADILEMVGLSDRAGHLPKELSGGQMQRTAIARALIGEPSVLIADEPTGNLDKTTGESIFALFRKLSTERDPTIIITTHNMTLGYEADRVITLEDGKIVKEEKPAKWV